MLVAETNMSDGREGSGGPQSRAIVAWRLGASSIPTNDRSCAFASCLTRRRPYGRRHRLAIPRPCTEHAVKHRDLIRSLVATAATAALLAGCGDAGSPSA